MPRQHENQTARFRLHELCQRLDASDRDARYFCEKRWLPEGVAREPGRGNHRQLTAAQAVWLGIVLELKACGVRTKMAARIAAFADLTCPQPPSTMHALSQDRTP